MDRLSHLVMFNLVFLLCQFAAFAYYVINYFIFVSTSTTLASPLGVINFHFNIISVNDITLCYYQKKLAYWSDWLIVWETRVKSQVGSYQRLKKWYLMPPCFTLIIIRYGLRVISFLNFVKKTNFFLIFG